MGRCFRGVGRLCSSGVRESAHPSTRSSDVMIRPVLPGPRCQGSNSMRQGTTRQGTQRYRCQATAGQGRTVLLAYTDAGHAAGVKQPSLAMAMHASGMRATARVLHGSPTPVITALQKKEPAVQPVHHAVADGLASQAGRGGKLALGGACGGVVDCAPHATPCGGVCKRKRLHDGAGPR